MAEEASKTTETQELEELNALLEESKKRQEKELADVGGPAVYYITLAKMGTKALKKSNKDLYIPDLKLGQFFNQNSKTVLGDEVKVVPLSFVMVYQEKDSRDVSAQYYGLWNKEQAVRYPLVDNSYFDRQLPNGHILQPTGWVMVQIVGHPEIENAVIPYKSTGTRIWKEWKKDAKERSATSATLVYTIKEETYSNDKNEWSDIGFEYTENLLDTDKSLAISCLKKSNSIRKAYDESMLIANHNVEALPSAKLALPEEKAQAEEVVF